jgi:segregation and condensation protein A
VKQRAHVVKRQPVLALETARRRLVQMMPELIEWTSVQSMRVPQEVAGEAPQRSVTASFFSAALELTRDRAIELRQDKLFSDLYVRKMQLPKAAE